MTFNVIDPKTGEYPDLEHISRTEEWAQNLIPCDVEGFCINEDGNLLLMDECRNCVYCPPDRFEIKYFQSVFDDVAVRDTLTLYASEIITKPEGNIEIKGDSFSFCISKEEENDKT